MYTYMVGVRPTGAHMEIRTQLSTNIIPILFGARVSVFYHTHTQYNNVQYYILLFARNFAGKRMEEKKYVYIF